jgi:hypothetical protein
MRFLFSFLVLFVIGQITAQNIEFYAATDAPVLDASSKQYQVLQNSQFQVSFIIQNGQGTSFQPPDFKGLAVISGPMSSTEVSIINGRRSEKRSYIYTIVGSRVGQFEVGKASIQTSKGTLTTNPFTVVVVKGNDSVDAAAGKTFVQVELSDSTTYIGQQIIMELKLYTRENVKSYEAITDFNYDGFYVRNLNEFSRKSAKMIINGQEYFSTTLKAVALFPQQTGTYTIPSFAVRVGIPRASRRRSLFTFQEYDYKVINTGTRTIEVDDVPLGAPLSFSGAVGKYTASFSIDKRSVSTDDNITMIMEIRGDGDGKKIISPMVDFGENFEIYEPNLLRDEDYVNGGRVVNYKSYEFLIVPRKAGNYRLGPEFTYFNVDSNEYVTIGKKPEFKVNVVSGSSEVSDLSTLENRNLVPDLPTNKRTKPAYGFVGSPWHIGLIFFLGLGLLGMISHQLYLQKLAGIDPSIRKRKKANKVALKRLEAAKVYLDQDNERAFYDEISKAVIKYLENKLTIATGSLDKGQLIATLQKEGVSSQTGERLSQLIQKAEIALFAGGTTGQMDNMYQNALDIIGEIEDLPLESN